MLTGKALMSSREPKPSSAMTASGGCGPRIARCTTATAWAFVCVGEVEQVVRAREGADSSHQSATNRQGGRSLLLTLVVLAVLKSRPKACLPLRGTPSQKE
jgi:hypothetical protein